jgi:hypothetical protein
MSTISQNLSALFNEIPRRHNPENVKQITALANGVEDELILIEAINKFYEKEVAIYFDTLETIRSTIKKSNDNKLSKKSKDVFFDEAASNLKDCIEEILVMYKEGANN